MTVVSIVNRRKPNMVEYWYTQILLAEMMTMKTLAERFEVLEQDYNAVISTEYMGTSAFGNESQKYIDSAKGNNWIARAKKLLEDSYGKESDYYKDFNDKKRPLGLVIIRVWLSITNLFLMLPEKI